MESSTTRLCPEELVAVLKACALKKDLLRGAALHANILRKGLLEKNPHVASSLVSMYAKCGALAQAHQVLLELPARDAVIWNALIASYTQQGYGLEALNCLNRMQQEGLSPNAVTFACALKACGCIGAADKGKQIHDEIAFRGLLGDDVVLGNALVDMYAKCGALSKAHGVLDKLPVRDVVSWNALITGYAQQGQGKDALNCFDRMRREGLSPNTVTFICILKACGSLGAHDKGKQIHDEILSRNLIGKDIVLGNALVDMYAKCGALTKAHQVLDELPARDAISWSTLISGYAQQGQGKEALACFERMQCEGFPPDSHTFICMLKACGRIGAVDKGKELHDEIVNFGLLGSNIVLDNALVDMYAKCGASTEAQQVLDKLQVRDVVSWNALITGFAQQGQGEEALTCLERMQHEGLSPDLVTLTSLLNAFSRSGLVDEGLVYLRNISKRYGITPGLEHQTCIADLFGRAGHFDEALTVIKKMQSSDDPQVWSVLLGACLKWGNVKLGKWAFERAIQVDKNASEAYICMASIYASAGMQEDAEKIETMRFKVLHRKSQDVVGG